MFDMNEANNDIILSVDIEDLWHHSCVVNEIWVEQVGPILKHHVSACLETEDFESASYQIMRDKLAGDSALARNWHTRRIAYLVRHGWSEPIDIEISRERVGRNLITDGNHRLAAAIFRGDDTIEAAIHGFYEDAPNHLPSLRSMSNRCHCLKCNEPVWLMTLGDLTPERMRSASCLMCGGEVVRASLI